MFSKANKQLMQKGAYALFCFFVSLCSFSQVLNNLVNNPSFELYYNCPPSLTIGNIYNTQYWFKSGYYASCDYFNSCATTPSLTTPNNMVGTQIPKTGNAYGGFITYQTPTFNNYREYLENGLKQTLKLNKTYCVSFYISLSERSRFGSANIGFLFSKDSIVDHSVSTMTTLLNYTPNYESNTILLDTINWTQIQNIFVSSGIENFITIGNFKNDASTLLTQVKSFTSDNYAYYYIDDVSVVEINNATASIKDTLVRRCVLDSVILGTDSTEFATYTWQSTAAGLAALSCTNCPNPIAKPLVTTKYYLTKVQCSSTTKDSVTVVVLTPTTQANAGNDINVCPNDAVQLGTADSTAFVSYNWQFAGNSSLSCTNCAMPLANVQQTTEFILQRTECNIITHDTVNVIVDLCDITIPTVFTPNNDNINDVWKFKLPTGAKLNALNVYNRWGLLVYTLTSQQLPPNSERSTLNLQWDGFTTAGIACNEGTYFYTLTYTDKKSEAHNLKGYVSLFR